MPPKAKFGLVADLTAEGISVQQSCRVLLVSEAGYYEWRKRPPSARAIRHAWLSDQITQIHVDSRGIYGAHRVRAELLHGQGIVVGHNAVAMLMQRAGLKGLPNRRVRYRPAGIATAADLVDRRFSPNRPGPAVGHRHHRARDQGRQALLLRSAGPLLPAGRRLVHRQCSERDFGYQRLGDGDPQLVTG